MRVARIGWLAIVVLIVLSCAKARQPGTPSPSTNRAHYTAKAADCRFSMPDSSPLMGEAEVDVVPRMIAPGPQVYPAELKQLGVSGRVIVTYVIDRQGRMVPPSLRVVQTSDVAFVPATAEMLRTSRFSPAVHLGVPVAVCVQQIVNFAVM